MTICAVKRLSKTVAPHSNCHPSFPALSIAMGPKKKAGKGKKAEETEAVAETADQAEWKQLKMEADRLHRLTKKEEHDFNEFQQQREKLNYFWIVEKKKLEDKRVELRNKEREQQDLEEKHQVSVTSLPP